MLPTTSTVVAYKWTVNHFITVAVSAYTIDTTTHGSENDSPIKANLCHNSLLADDGTPQLYKGGVP